MCDVCVCVCVFGGWVLKVRDLGGVGGGGGGFLRDRRAAFSSQIKSKVGNILVKAASLCINLT